MGERRVTLSLDDDVIEALQVVGDGRSMSAVANDVRRAALERTSHHAALAAWIGS